MVMYIFSNLEIKVSSSGSKGVNFAHSFNKMGKPDLVET
jgi:hypothetical protein